MFELTENMRIKAASINFGKEPSLLNTFYNFHTETAVLSLEQAVLLGCWIEEDEDEDSWNKWSWSDLTVPDWIYERFPGVTLSQIEMIWNSRYADNPSMAPRFPSIDPGGSNSPQKDIESLPVPEYHKPVGNIRTFHAEFPLPPKLFYKWKDGVKIFTKSKYCKQYTKDSNPIYHERIVKELTGAGILVPSSKKGFMTTMFTVPKDKDSVRPSWPKNLYYIKLDVAQAFFNINVHKKSQFLLTMILLRNIAQSEDLCNGTRFIIKNMHKHFLDVEMDIGKHIDYVKT